MLLKNTKKIKPHKFELANVPPAGGLAVFCKKNWLGGVRMHAFPCSPYFWTYQRNKNLQPIITSINIRLAKRYINRQRSWHQLFPKTVGMSMPKALTGVELKRVCPLSVSCKGMKMSRKLLLRNTKTQFSLRIEWPQTWRSTAKKGTPKKELLVTSAFGQVKSNFACKIELH